MTKWRCPALLMAFLISFSGIAKTHALIVGSYNLHNLDQISLLREDFSRLSFVDVWGFQEVAFRGLDAEFEFAQSWIDAGYFVASLPVALMDPAKDRWEGHMIVSRFSIKETGSILLEGNTAKVRRALYAILQVEDQQVLFINTDHDVGFFNTGYLERRKNVQSLLKGLKQIAFNGPMVLVGDFNTADSALNWSRGLKGEDEVRLTHGDLANADWTSAVSGEELPFTLKRFGIQQQLDHLFFKHINKVSQWHRLNDRRGSDHFPIFVELQLDSSNIGL